MSDLRSQISSAARQAVQLGQGKDSRVIEIFRERVPAKVRLPLSPLPIDLKRISELIELVANGEAVINGEETTGHPSVLALGVSPNPITFGCTGFLVSPDIVVTAAHCIADGFTGGLWTQDSSGVRRFLSPLPGGSVMHSGFGDPTPFINDIGMIRLSEPTVGIEINRVADSMTIDQAKILRIVGFGNDENGTFSIDVKRTVNVHIRLNPSDGTIGFKDLEFVIGDPLVSTDGDACDRDSGGSVIVDVGGTHHLAGLISRPANLNVVVCGQGTICLRLDRYVDWIDETIQHLGGQPRAV